MKSLAVADRRGLPRFVAHQAYYSLANRDYEWELMPLAVDQGVGTVVWSPLASGLLTGRIRRDAPPRHGMRRAARPQDGPHVDEERLYAIIDTLNAISNEIGRPIVQIALNWLLRRPTVSSVVIGARTEAQLRENVGAIQWVLSDEHIAQLDEVSSVTPPYPYWHQQGFSERNPSPI